MGAGKDTILKLVRSDRGHARESAVLADLYKALKAIGFYPPEHPLREEILQTAHGYLHSLLSEHDLVLVVTRSGFSDVDGGAIAGGNPMVDALAGELFVRRIQRLAFLNDVTVADLRSFLHLLSLDPQKLASCGGMSREMMTQGIRTIWTNEIDLSVIWEKRHSMDGAVAASSGSEGHDGNGEDTLQGGGSQPEDILPEVAEPALEDLIALMDVEPGDNRYQQLARMLVSRAEEIKERGACGTLLPVIESLMRHNDDDGKSAVKKEYALFTLEQIADGAMTDFLLQQLEITGAIEKERIYAVLGRLGATVAYGIIQRLCLADGLLARKSLATALLRIGPPAIPPLLAMLKDERWHVVRNMVAIVGEIGCQVAAKGLRPAIVHEDPRVRKEAVRSLAKIGGRDAESILISLLDDGDESIVRHAILTLGILKSAAAVLPLIGIVEKRDIFAKRLSVKKDAVQALGRIGDQRATVHLMNVLEAHRWIPWNRWDDLKVVAATALGQLGDEAALPALKSYATCGGRLGRACIEAVDNIERVAEGGK